MRYLRIDAAPVSAWVSADPEVGADRRHALGALLARAPSAEARANGIVADACDGCHGSGMGTPPDLTVTADPATPKPGDAVTFTLTIQVAHDPGRGRVHHDRRRRNPSGTRGRGPGRQRPGAHAHRAQAGGPTAPSRSSLAGRRRRRPGAVDVHVAALAGNGNNAPTGDSPGAGDFQWVFGCTGTTFYADLDRDGYGSKAWGTRLGCLGDPPPTGYAAVDGDCDENDQTVHPGATEICNMKDDDCNGQIDENAPPVMLWPDADGDGYYAFQTGTPKVGCGSTSPATRRAAATATITTPRSTRARRKSATSRTTTATARSTSACARRAASAGAPATARPATPRIASPARRRRRPATRSTTIATASWTTAPVPAA